MEMTDLGDPYGDSADNCRTEDIKTSFPEPKSYF